MNIQQILSERRKERKLKLEQLSMQELIVMKDALGRADMANVGARKIIENILIPIFSELEEKAPNTTELRVEIFWQYATKKSFSLTTKPQLFKKTGVKKYKNPTPELTVDDVMQVAIKLAPKYGFQIGFSLPNSFNKAIFTCTLSE